MFKLPWRQNTSNNLPLKESDIQLPKKRSSITDLIMKIKAVGYINNNTYRREKFQRC